MKILLVEDNAILAKNIREYLKIKGMNVETELYGDRAYQKILDTYYDVVLLDINLPVKDGISILKDLRRLRNNTPIIMLTSRNTTRDVVAGFTSGADDYISKPFDMEELISRIEAMYRRTAVNKSNNLEVNGINIDLEKRLVKRGEEIIELSKLEFDLLKYFAQNRGVPVDRKTLFEKVWGDFDEHMFSRTVDVYISYLRKKFGPDFIETKKGFGYLVN
ncbi:MAG: response regulator transcription factor [Candidatus Gracilibacteria bacterium]|nr:response regulator transcription factor [Candidatus Gracilibacteria bacterium]